MRQSVHAPTAVGSHRADTRSDNCESASKERPELPIKPALYTTATPIPLVSRQTRRKQAQKAIGIGLHLEAALESLRVIQKRIIGTTHMAPQALLRRNDIPGIEDLCQHIIDKENDQTTTEAIYQILNTMLAYNQRRAALGGRHDLGRCHQPSLAHDRQQVGRVRFSSQLYVPFLCRGVLEVSWGSRVWKAFLAVLHSIYEIKATSSTPCQLRVAIADGPPCPASVLLQWPTRQTQLQADADGVRCLADERQQALVDERAKQGRRAAAAKVNQKLEKHAADRRKALEMSQTENQSVALWSPARPKSDAERVMGLAWRVSRERTAIW